MYEETTEKLLEFISKSPTAFQAAEETRRRFLEEGFTELKEEERWELEKGGKYFVMRNHSAIIGFPFLSMTAGDIISLQVTVTPRLLK